MLTLHSPHSYTSPYHADVPLFASPPYSGDHFMPPSPKFRASRMAPLVIGDAEYLFYFDEGSQPIVECRRKGDSTYHTSADTLLAASLVSHQAPLPLAILVNFIVFGNEYRLISDPEQFKTDYAELVKKEENTFQFPTVPGNLDLGEITVPSIHQSHGNTHLTFYVERNMRPFKITANYSHAAGKASVSCGVLDTYSSV